VEAEVRENRNPKDMSTDDLVAVFELATRLRQREPDFELDSAVGKWLDRATAELKSRGLEHLERVRDFLPVYYDPSRREPVYGPGAVLCQSAGDDDGVLVKGPVRQLRAAGA
jgi:hypothetical protein